MSPPGDDPGDASRGPDGSAAGVAGGRARWRLRHPADREIARLALPALGALAAPPLYVLTDTAVVGHLGTPELGGLAVAGTVIVTVLALCVFLAYGTTAAVGRLLGAGRPAEAAAEAVAALWLAAGLGVAVVVAGQLTAGAVVDLMGASGEVRPHALWYLRIGLWGVPFHLVTLAGAGYLRGLRDTRTTMVVAVGTAVLNGVVEVVAVFGLGYGLGASAASTVLAEAVGAAAYVRFVARSCRSLGVPLRPPPGAVRRLGRVSVDLFVRTAALRGSLTLATAVAARMGTVAVAAHHVAFEVWSFLALVLDSVAIAAQALIAGALGAGEPAEARRLGRRMIELTVAGSAVVAVGVAAAGGVLASVFSGDPAVRATAGDLLVWVAVLQPVNAVVFTLDGVLIGAGDMAFLARAMVVSAAVFVPAAVAVAVTGAGVGALWAAIGLLMVTRAGTLWWRWRGTAWMVPGARR